MLWKQNYVWPIDNNDVHTDGRLVSLAANSTDEYISELEAYIKEAAEQAKYVFILRDARNSEALQLAQVESAREVGEKAVVIFLVNSVFAPELLNAANNMKVVFVDRVPADISILNPNAVLVGSDETDSGKIQGEWLANHFKERGKNEIRYILLEGPPNVIATKQRTEAALQALADNGIKAVKVAPTIVANFDRKQALTKILPILESGVSFDTIISNNDAMALGAIEAMESLNMNPSKKVIVGIDAIQPAVRAILEGKMAMTVFQNTEAQGTTAVKALLNMLDGRPIDQGTGYQVSADNPYIIWIPFELVTRLNIPKDLYF